MQHPWNVSRRQLLALVGRACGVGAALSVSRCAVPSPSPAAAPELSVALAELPEGQRVRFMLGEEPVELLRRGDEVQARSLLCSHVGCEVEWRPTESYYQCPCHDGRYGPDGRVLSGPPPLPLEDLETSLDSGRVTLQRRKT